MADDSTYHVFAFSSHQVLKLTTLSAHQLSYWERSGFFSPEYREDADRREINRVYSFRDLVGLRALGEMRNRFEIPLQKLRRIGAALGRFYQAPWSELTFYIVGRRVFFRDEHDQAIRTADSAGQTVMPFELRKVERELDEAIRQQRTRTHEMLGQITRHRYVADNKPVLAGTRVPTRAIWDFHEAGYSNDAILRQYPQLQAKDIQAAIDFERPRQAIIPAARRRRRSA